MLRWKILRGVGLIPLVVLAYYCHKLNREGSSILISILFIAIYAMYFWVTDIYLKAYRKKKEKKKKNV